MRSSEDLVNSIDDNFVSSFEKSTCSGDSVCDIFENEDENMPEDSIVWVIINK